MGAVSRGIFWFGTYLALVLGPLVAASLVPGTGHRPSVELGRAAGFVAFGLLTVELALVARLRVASAAFGTDVLMLAHRYMGTAAVGFVLLHALLLAEPRALVFASGPVLLGTVALWCLVALVAASVLRRRARLPYEVWRASHTLLALGIVGASLAHAVALPGDAGAGLTRGVLWAWAATFGAAFAYYRVLRPLALWRRPWEIVAGRDSGGDVRTLTLAPVGHPGLRFEPGQFAWLNTGRTPFSAAEHPVSLSSSADPSAGATVEFSIKALGSWSRDVVPDLRVGARAWVDGPFGAFSPDHAPAQGFVLIAGGIGIAPMRSILLTLRDRADPRPVLLIRAAHDASRAIFSRELRELRERMPLTIVDVFERRPPGDPGETGFVTRELLVRHLPADAARRAYFVCGPAPMMDAVEAALVELGVPPERVFTERFDMV